MNNLFKTRISRWVSIAVCVALAMCVSYAVSYKIIRKSAPQNHVESAPGNQNENYDKDKPFPNLPVTISGGYQEGTGFTDDMNDYLVIAENNIVALYSIDKEDTKTFERVLEIDLASLKREDRELLKKGILLNDKSAVLSLIEDYSS